MTLIPSQAFQPWNSARGAAPLKAKVVMLKMKKLLQARMNLKIGRLAFLKRWGALREELSSTPEYQAFRLEVLTRDNFRCTTCGHSTRTVHHRRRVARALHLALDPRNAVAKCDDCHAKVHPWMRKA